MCCHVYTQDLLKRTGDDDDCSLVGAFDRNIPNLENFKCLLFALGGGGGGVEVLI